MNAAIEILAAMELVRMCLVVSAVHVIMVITFPITEIVLVCSFCT